MATYLVRISVALALYLFLQPAMAKTSMQDALRQQFESWSAGYPAQIENSAIENIHSIALFYEESQYRSLWMREGSLKKEARDLIAEISTIGNEGLLPSDYHYSAIQQYVDSLASNNAAQLEILLSDSFLKLLQHLLNGKIDPASLTPEWKSVRENFDAKKHLERILTGESIQSLLKSIRPTQARYYRLQNTIKTINSQDIPPWDALKLSPPIKFGESDERISTIKKRLKWWGDLPSSAHQNDSTNTKYDDSLKSAVINFQLRHGLESDGVIGKMTLEAINISPRERVKQLIVNLERWRWLDQNMGENFIVVNIASFDLRVYKDNNLIFQKPVIVGRNYRKTPVFSDRIRYIVFNPTWTVPQSIAIKDKLPDIKKDISYLNKYQFTLYELSGNKIVDPQSVNWNALTKSFPFRMVQSPGPLNALGQVKFMFPNPYDVYLHDTPSRELFKKTERAFSSGCIRVSDPIELATLLLEPDGHSSQKIMDILAKQDTTTIYLKKPFPVHMEYWTAWVDSNNNLHFRNDIYERDAPVWRALTN